jgi:hypothetical protein
VGQIVGYRYSPCSAAGAGISLPSLRKYDEIFANKLDETCPIAKESNSTSVELSKACAFVHARIPRDWIDIKSAKYVET